MWLVVGLGNPGSKYAHNRHNIGFMVVDAIGSGWKAKFGGETTTATLAGEKVVLLKPLEFMNLSGFATQKAAAFHGIDVKQIVVVHDEIDLPFGVVRLKNGGGHGGHNGLRSIHEQLGSPDYARLRMGVGRDPNARPGAKDAAGWVLGDFPSAHGKYVDAMIAAGREDLEAVVTKGIVPAMNQHNGRSNLGPA